jgi:CBS domain-containing protein
MTHTVRDFMTPKLVYVRDDTHLRVALHPILEMGITAVPVLDGDHRPVGVISLRDLLENPTGDIRPASKPVLQIEETATIESAARLLSEAQVHHLVVVDTDGQAVGMLSSLDVVRALLHATSHHAS